MDLGYSIVLGLGIFCTFGLIGFLSWLDFKKSEHNTKKTDPILKALIISFGLSGILFLAEAVGYFEKGWNQKFFWVHILILVSIISIYMIIASRKKPLPYWKQKAIIKQILKEEYEADSYVGKANIRFLQSYNYLKEGEIEETRGEVGSFLVKVKAEDVFRVWVKINAYTGQLLKLRPDPPLGLETEALKGKAPVKDEFLEEFEGNNQPNNET
jgi:hypothetical protein